MKNYLNFELEIKNLELELEKLKDPYNQEGLSEVDTTKISELQTDINNKLKHIYSNLDHWQTTLVARHEERPEGYRKTIRLMKLANKFKIPIISFIDTPGAYPGVGAEERGQAEAISKSIECSMELTVPNISIIIGEGGSGGAIALASSNKVIMLENAIYSVISPEGCATILWRDPKKTLEASKAMKLSSKDLYDLKIIDEIIPEPVGGAHRDKDVILNNVRESIRNNLNFFLNMDKEQILSHRKNKFLSIGRSRGLSSGSITSDNLSMKTNVLDKFFNKFLNNKSYFIISIFVAILILLYLFLL